jgi:hypothetical protein
VDVQVIDGRSPAEIVLDRLHVGLDTTVGAHFLCVARGMHLARHLSRRLARRAVDLGIWCAGRLHLV